MNRHDKKNQTISILIVALMLIPIVYVYFKFFSMAFFDDNGGFGLSNFEFLTKTIKLQQTVVPPIGSAFLNSVIFTIIVTLMEVGISLVSGYALSRFEFKGRDAILKSLLVLRMFPSLLLLIGVLYVLIEIKIVNSLLGVVLVAIAFRLPSSTYIIKNFFDEIPSDIENSTLVDGCSRFSSFYQVIIHLVKNGIASISIFSFLSAWSNYILFNTLIFNGKTPVIATYIRALSRSEQMIAPYPIFAAMGLVYMLPVIVFFIISQRQLMQSSDSLGKGV